MAEGKQSPYRWLILISGMVLTGVSLGFYLNCNAAFLVPVTEEMGISRGLFSLRTALISLTTIPAMPFFAYLFKRHALRSIMLPSALFGGLMYLAAAYTHNITLFVLTGVGIGIFIPGFHFFGVGILINQWFDTRKGLMMGIASSGSGLFGAVGTPFVAYLLKGMPWREAMTVIGGVGLAVSVLFATLIRQRQVVAGQEKSISDTGTPWSTVRKKPAFYTMMFAFFVFGVISYALLVHVYAYLGDINFTPMEAASISSIAFLLMMVSKTIMGWYLDKVPRLLGGPSLGVLLALCLLCLLLAGSFKPAVWAYAVFFGFGFTTVSVPLSFLPISYWGQKDYGFIFSLVSCSAALGGAIGQFLTGVVYDHLGSYVQIWIFLAATALLAAAAMFYTAKYCSKYKTYDSAPVEQA